MESKKMYVVYDSLKRNKDYSSSDVLSLLSPKSGDAKIFGVFDDKLKAERFVNSQNEIAEVRSYNYLDIAEIDLNIPARVYNPAEYIYFTGKIRSDGRYLSSDFEVKDEDFVCYGISKEDSTLSWACDKSFIEVGLGKDYNFICYGIYMKNLHPSFITLSDLKIASRVFLLCIKEAMQNLELWEHFADPNKQINWSETGFEEKSTSEGFLRNFVHKATNHTFDEIMREAMKIYSNAYFEEYGSDLCTYLKSLRSQKQE